MTFKNNILRHNWPQNASLEGDDLKGLSLNSNRRKVLLLQGPVGPFFKVLNRFLTNNNFDVWRVVFNMGDRFYSKKNKRISFINREKDNFDEWLEVIFLNSKIDAIILFGCCRPAHQTAIKLAKKHNIEIISLEEEYIRPGFISIEKFGNNAHSPIAGKVHEESYKKNKELQPFKMTEGINFVTLYATIYYLLSGLFKSSHNRKYSHRNVVIWSEVYHWNRNFARWAMGYFSSKNKISELTNKWSKRYFIVALQVEGDANLGEAALGWDTQKLVESCIKSFVKNAPKNTKLVLKIHPRSRGYVDLISFSKMVKCVANGEEDLSRIDIIHIGSMGLLAKHSAGMVTINSSSGLSAIFHGIPLLVMGNAIYNHPNLVTNMDEQADLDNFWNKNFVAKSSFRNTYLSWFKEKTLMPGDFYHRHGIEVGCNSVLKKLVQ